MNIGLRPMMSVRYPISGPPMMVPISVEAEIRPSVVEDRCRSAVKAFPAMTAAIAANTKPSRNIPPPVAAVSRRRKAFAVLVFGGAALVLLVDALMASHHLGRCPCLVA